MLPCAPGAAAEDPFIGQRVSEYRITRRIGHGGMGAVYEAVHQRIGQRAAIKILSPEFSRDEDAVHRLVAEAQAAAQVRHGGLVQIFDHGTLADGTAYILMEYLDGDSLRTRLDRLALAGQRMPMPEVVRLGQQIASALRAVHQAGIVHRDLKPANLLLVADPEIPGGERIKVVDFGIAKFNEGGPSDLSQTTVGRFLGTALYASPEQCQMTGHVTSKADVYALGVILYEMLAGLPPFVAKTPGAVIGMHLFLEPLPLWTHAPSVPEGMHQLVHQMLAKEPAQRPSMDEVLARLEGMRLQGPTWLWWARRHPEFLVGVALGALLLAGTWLQRSRRPAPANLPAAPAAVPSVPSVPAASPARPAAGPEGTPAPPPSPELRREARPKSRPRPRPQRTSPAPLPAGQDPALAAPAPPPAAPADERPPAPAPGPGEERPQPAQEKGAGEKKHERVERDDGIFR